MTENKEWTKNFNDYPKGTQQHNILNHLNERGHITAMEALILYRVFRLSARICNLRDDGYTIDTVFKTDMTGKRYAQYRIL